MTALIVELICTVMSFCALNNLWVYNVYLPCEVMLLSCFAVSSSAVRPLRPVALVLLIGYAVVVHGEFEQAWQTGIFITRSYVAGGLVLATLFAWLLFNEAFTSATPMFRQSKTWVFLANTLFFGATIPLLGLTNVLIAEGVTWAPRMYFINDLLFTIRYGTVVFVTLQSARWSRLGKPA